MKQKLTLIMAATLLLGAALFFNSVTWCFEKQTPTRIPSDQIFAPLFPGQEKDRAFCIIQNDDGGDPAWFCAGFDSGMAVAVHMDPAQCGGLVNSFRITDVHFYLYGYFSDSTKWPVEIQVNIRDIPPGGKCDGPDTVLYSEGFSIPSDSAYWEIGMINLSLSHSYCVAHPFFLEIEYISKTDPTHPLPSLLMDDEVTSADTCNNWVWTDGDYYEWSDAWEPIPGDAFIRATGYTSEECIYPEHFVFTDSTGESYSIVIDSAFLDGFELEECDEVGVFDDTGNGKGLLCVGASVYHPDSLSIYLMAWKDDPLTPQKDGYTPGDTMYFRVWSRNQDREECVLSHYSIGDGRFGTGTHSQLWLGGSCVECDTKPLYAGWQWISTNIDPDPCEMESIFVNCWTGYLDIIIACDGSFCIPGVGCWIDCWRVCEMYKLHMAAECTIEVCGSKVPTDKPCPLPAGWNCIAYFPECPLEPETALVSIWDNLDIVQNDAGEFCIPGVGCWIECMEYNEGYKIYLSSADTLVYPINCPPCPPPFAKKNTFPGFARTAHFNYSGNTGESYSIVVNSIDLNGKQPEVGDEIGVFTSSGLCVGGGVWQGGILGIAAWQDDDRTEVVDGFQVGEQMIFKLWDKSDNKEIELTFSLEKGDGRFGTVAYALVNLNGVSSQLPEKFELAQNYPNPFNPETKISYALAKDCHVKLTIYNVMGQKIRVLVDEHQIAGYKYVHWDGKDYKGNEVASGIYFYRIQTEDISQTKKMVLMR